MSDKPTTLRDIGASEESAGKPPAQRQEDYRAVYEANVVRLGNEIERMIKLVSWARECLENELIGTGLGYKKMGISEKDVQKLKNLTAAVEQAANTKIRYDKAAKELAASMTPEEEYEAVWAYCLALPIEKKKYIRDRLSELMLYERKAAQP